MKGLWTLSQAAKERMVLPFANDMACVIVRHHARTMKYYDGSPVRLGDIVTIPLKDCRARARVVMLGDTREHLDIDKRFLGWIESDNTLLGASYVVVEWVDRNPLAHNDPQYGPVGNYMFTKLDECVTHDA